mgnify:FL=1
MAYFNHAFNKTFLATSIAGADVATSALTTGQFALVSEQNATGTKHWQSVLAAGAAPVVADLPKGTHGYLVQGSVYTKDTIGNNPGHGGYKESVKSKGINPRYITEMWKSSCSVASNATAKLCLAADCAPCGKTQFMRIDVKGSPALRFLNHNAYAIADSANICCIDGQEYLDAGLVIATMAEMAIGNGLMKSNLKYVAGDPLITPFVGEGDPDGAKTLSAIAAGGVGSGYALGTSLATVATAPSKGTGLTVQITAIAAAVATVGSLVGGTGYTAAVGVATSASPAGGTGATITTLTSGGAGTPVTTATLVAGGAGYSVGDVLTITGGGGNATVTVATIAATGAIKTVTVLDEGAGYAAADTVTVTQTGGSAGVLTVATVSEGAVEITLTTAAGVVTTEYYSIAQAVGKAASGNYVPSTDPNGTTKVSACVTFKGAYVDTEFGNCSFDTRDHYNAEPVEIIVSSLDETGNPCNDCGVASRTPGSMQQTQGERVIRELIMSERYRQSPYNQGNASSARIREIEMSDELLASVTRSSTYLGYYFKHSVPRFNNPSGVFDNDQYVYKVYVKCDDAALITAMDNMFTTLSLWSDANFNPVPFSTTGIDA